MGRRIVMGLIALTAVILVWAAPVNALDTEEKIGVLEKKVSDLEGKLTERTSSLEQITKFMEEHKLKASLWLQSWYQFVEDGKNNGNENLHDFMFRRFYFYLKGEVTPQLGFFAHIAGDRIGQDNLDSPGQGLGSGIAVRDGWIYYNFNESFKVQMGRMYPPFTRNYGTTSTKTLLTVDLPFTQGGVRGGIFYASKVGRDDGVVLWGNPFAGLLQYRLGVSEGVEGAENPDDSLRFTGRVSLNLLEPETSWFNQGTYLGKKKILAIGGGFDRQDDLRLTGRPDQRDNTAWTADIFFDHPVGEGALTVEAAYIDVKNVTQTLSFSRLVSGDDAQIYYIQGGYLIPGKIGPGRIQPYFRYERLSVDEKPDTVFPSVGVNYYLKGHDAKLTLDFSLVDQREEVKNFRGNWTGENQNLITLQFQVGI